MGTLSLLTSIRHGENVMTRVRQKGFGASCAATAIWKSVVVGLSSSSMTPDAPAATWSGCDSFDVAKRTKMR